MRFELTDEQREFGSALGDLLNEGLIFTLHGKGSFVSRPKAFQDLARLQGFGEAMRQMGYETYARVLSLRSEMRGSGPLQALGSFNPAMLVHGEQSFTLHKPLTVSGTAVASSRIAAIYDKGKAAVVVLESTAKDPQSGEPLFTTSSSMFIRGEGGWGGDRGPSAKFEAPARTPDHVVSYQTRPDQALLYRLNGDRNPLHADPKFAALGGFDKPILHGLCTMAMTSQAVIKSVAGGDPARLRRLAVRFAANVLPGNDVDTTIWSAGERDGRKCYAFEATSAGATVIKNGWAEVDA